MPIVDLPLEQLQAYQGRNPRPQDFDAYWARALEELDRTDPQVRLEPAAFQVPGAECFDLTFTGVGGGRVYAKYLRPICAKPHPAVLQFHGYTGSSGEWADKLPFVLMGFSIAALDCRGQACRSEDLVPVQGNTHTGHIIRGLDQSAEALYYRRVFLDTVRLARIVMSLPEVDANRVGAWGVSQGGGLTLACAALEPRIRRIAPWIPFLCDYQRVWEMDLAVDAYAELKTYFRFFDPTHARQEEVFTRLGYIDCQHLAPRIRAEVFWGLGLMDTVCPPSTQFAAYNRIQAPKQMRIYPDYAHETPPGWMDESLRFLAEL